ncbi:MAG: DUF479 domain-containing protein [Saprospiraceae bacterium]|nr:DUF479 domain-containing protein [Saprospiraceae bacterium]
MKWETLQLEIINFSNKMNYLSHLSLSYPNPGLLGGNYIYDLLNYSESKQINSFFHEGIQLHKWIDNFSNNSEHLKEINSYLHPVVHKYAPVASDIFCDHLLFLQWDQYFKFTFEEFENTTYQILGEVMQFMPDRIANICLNMTTHRFMSQYKNYEGLENVYVRMNKKTKFPVDFRLVLPVLAKNIDLFQQLFGYFFKECNAKVQAQINLQNETKQ